MSYINVFAQAAPAAAPAEAAAVTTQTTQPATGTPAAAAEEPSMFSSFLPAAEEGQGGQGPSGRTES